MAYSALDQVKNLRINTAPTVHHALPGWAWSPSPLPDYDFWFVERGRGNMLARGDNTPLEPGTCFLWRPGDAPSGTQDETNRLVVFSCHFSPLDQAGQPCEAPRVPYPLRVRDTPFFVASAHRSERLWRRDTPESRAAAVDLLLTLLWQLEDEATQPGVPEDAVLQSLARAILERPGQPWSLDAMSRTCHLSRAQMVRRFRAALGTSPAQFVINARVERARQLLLESDWTLEQIAHSLGYSDVYFFARQFKTVTGTPPGTLRKP